MNAELPALAVNILILDEILLKMCLRDRGFRVKIELVPDILVQFVLKIIRTVRVESKYLLLLLLVLDIYILSLALVNLAGIRIQPLGSCLPELPQY